MILETERLLLRRFIESDTQYIFELDNDPAVMRYINGGTPTEFSVVQNELMPTFLHDDASTSLMGFWAIIEKATANFCGWVSLRALEDELLEAVLGYRLCQRAWGNGYATEAAHVLIDNAFDVTDLERVRATTYEENTASQRVMEKLGMRLIRRFRYTEDDLADADTFHADGADLWDGDDLEYAVTRVEWK